MSYLPLEYCLDKSNGSVYQLVILAARRAHELDDGAKPLLEAKEKDNPLDLALEEIRQGLIEAHIEKTKKKKK